MLTLPKVILLDVYETLIDMSDVERKVNNLLDSKRGYAIWFELLMEYCFVDNCTGQYHDFNAIARATMRMAAKKLSVKINEEAIHAALDLLRHLPVHDDVQPGLSLLHDQKFRIAALTNTAEKTIADRMERTGLISYFEKVLSSEQVKKYKPSLEVYHWAATQMGVQPQEVLMVSSHGWDLAGAAHAGMMTAFLEQNRHMAYPLAPEPDLSGQSLLEIATKLKDMAG